jgi:acetyl-CoA acetyltransferase
MREAFIRDYARTPIGRFGGSLASMRASASVRASPSQSNGVTPSGLSSASVLERVEMMVQDR